jgi:hypothetical protein
MVAAEVGFQEPAPDRLAVQSPAPRSVYVDFSVGDEA